MRNPHAQTAFPAFFRRVPRLALRRAWVPTRDGDAVALYIGPPRRGPVLLVLHGLEGGVRSANVRGMMQRAAQAGWQACAMEQLTCSGRPPRGPRAYHSGETGDLDAVIATVRRRFPGRPLSLFGFSQGANIAAKWLGEADRAGTVAAAALVSPPLDLDRACAATDRVLGGAYARRFLSTLVPKGLALAARFPGRIDAARLRRCQSIREYDDLVTAPLHGFRDAADYYAQTSCRRFLPRVQTPALVVLAEDDPLIPFDASEWQRLGANPSLSLVRTRHGGHIGFVAGSAWRPDYWAERISFSFLSATAR